MDIEKFMATPRLTFAVTSTERDLHGRIIDWGHTGVLVELETDKEQKDFIFMPWHLIQYIAIPQIKQQ